VKLCILIDTDHQSVTMYKQVDTALNCVLLPTQQLKRRLLIVMLTFNILIQQYTITTEISSINEVVFWCCSLFIYYAYSAT